MWSVLKALYCSKTAFLVSPKKNKMEIMEDGYSEPNTDTPIIKMNLYPFIARHKVAFC